MKKTQRIEVDGENLKVATEEELLRFANRLREAGGANILKKLLPSTPSSPSACLIARALNFDCTVDAGRGLFKSGATQWSMYIDDPELGRKIAKNAKMSYRVLDRGTDFEAISIPLPEHIGNAAAAFDAGRAFQKFSRDQGRW